MAFRDTLLVPVNKLSTICTHTLVHNNSYFKLAKNNKRKKEKKEKQLEKAATEKRFSVLLKGKGVKYKIKL